MNLLHGVLDQKWLRSPNLMLLGKANVWRWSGLQQMPKENLKRFAMDNADATGKVVEVLIESLTLKETPILTKFARLMLVSDILHNSICSCERSTRDLGSTYSSSGSERAGDDNMQKTEEIEFTDDIGNSMHLDSGMNEVQRQKLRCLGYGILRISRGRKLHYEAVMLAFYFLKIAEKPSTERRDRRASLQGNAGEAEARALPGSRP